MADLLCLNSNDYVRILSAEYAAKSKKKGDTLEAYLDRKFGHKSNAGYCLKRRVLFAKGAHQYFAAEMHRMGSNPKEFKKHELEILHLFLCRYGKDLNEIRKQFNRQFQNDLQDVLNRGGKKNKGSQDTTYFLLKLLESSKRFS